MRGETGGESGAQLGTTLRITLLPSHGFGHEFEPVKFAQGTAGSKGTMINKSLARFSSFTWTGGTGECRICEKHTK